MSKKHLPLVLLILGVVFGVANVGFMIYAGQDAPQTEKIIGVTIGTLWGLFLALAILAAWWASKKEDL